MDVKEQLQGALVAQRACGRSSGGGREGAVRRRDGVPKGQQQGAHDGAVDVVGAGVLQMLAEMEERRGQRGRRLGRKLEAVLRRHDCCARERPGKDVATERPSKEVREGGDRNERATGAVPGFPHSAPPHPAPRTPHPAQRMPAAVRGFPHSAPASCLLVFCLPVFWSSYLPDAPFPPFF